MTNGVNKIKRRFDDPTRDDLISAVPKEDKNKIAALLIDDLVRDLASYKNQKIDYKNIEYLATIHKKDV